MNLYLTLRHRALAVALGMLAGPALAAPPVKPAEKKLIGKVFNDGVIFGFAQNCSLPEPELKKLYDKNYATSRALGISKVPGYTQANFRRDFQNGIATADRLSASVAPGSKAFQKNCDDVKKKVQLTIKGK